MSNHLTPELSVFEGCTLRVALAQFAGASGVIMDEMRAESSVVANEGVHVA